MARFHNTHTRFAGCALMLMLSAGCTDDFSRFRFGKKVPSSGDSGAQNMSNAAGNADASALKSKLPQAGRAATGVAGTGRPQAQGTHAGSSGGTAADAAQDFGERDD
jgi:hypothetical protein